MSGVFAKLNYKAQPVIHVTGAPDSFRAELDAMAAVAEVRATLGGAENAEFVLAFAVTQAEVDAFADAVARCAAPDAVIWTAYPKGTSKRYRCEFNRDTGWDRFGAHGYEPVRQIAIDEDWTALRFRRAEKIGTMARKRALSAAGKARIGR